MLLAAAAAGQQPTRQQWRLFPSSVFVPLFRRLRRLLLLFVLHIKGMREREIPSLKTHTHAPTQKCQQTTTTFDEPFNFRFDDGGGCGAATGILQLVGWTRLKINMKLLNLDSVK